MNLRLSLIFYFQTKISVVCGSAEKESVSVVTDWTADGTAYSLGTCPAKGTGTRHTLYSFNIIIRGGALQSVRIADPSATAMT